MKKALFGLVAILFLVPGIASAACSMPAAPADLRCSGFAENDTAGKNACLKSKAVYEVMVSNYNQCVADEQGVGTTYACLTSVENGTGKLLEGNRCKVTCDPGFYMTKVGTCIEKTVLAPEPVPIIAPVPVPETVVEPVPEPVIAPTSKPSITEAAKGVQLFAPKKEEVSPAKTEGEATTTPPPAPLPAKKPWWHYLNPFNWF